jgi:hypothetical protein
MPFGIGFRELMLLTYLPQLSLWLPCLPGL